MSTMIQVRNVPEAVHRVLKSRAAKQGVTLSDLCLRELKQAAERPTFEEIRERLAQAPSLDKDSGATAIIRAARDQD